MPEADTLATLEARVREKLAAAMPKWDFPDGPDWSEWLTDIELQPVTEPTDPQFPRERWVIYPNRRMVSLIIAENAIRIGHLSEAVFLLEYGGRVRIA